MSVLLLGFLTLFIALIGYRLLIGEGLSLRSGTIAMVKDPDGRTVELIGSPGAG